MHFSGTEPLERRGGWDSFRKDPGMMQNEYAFSLSVSVSVSLSLSLSLSDIVVLFHSYCTE
jgi:hypothetical protein